MPDVQILHPVFGRSAKDGATDTCSRCGHTIPEEHVPLIFWDATGEIMWVFCATCEEPMIARVFPAKENGCGNG